jgi:hypothetical protein
MTPLLTLKRTRQSPLIWRYEVLVNVGLPSHQEQHWHTLRTLRELTELLPGSSLVSAGIDGSSGVLVAELDVPAQPQLS